MPPENKAKQYQVNLCGNCHHPGGRHLGGVCNLRCDCEEWIPNGYGWWSDLRTEELS